LQFRAAHPAAAGQITGNEGIAAAVVVRLAGWHQRSTTGHGQERLHCSPTTMTALIHSSPHARVASV